jgi:hypothetical protein
MLSANSAQIPVFFRSLSGPVLMVMMLVLVVGVMIDVTMVVPGGGEGRAGKHHQEQGCGNNLLHGKNLARSPLRKKEITRPGI